MPPKKKTKAPRPQKAKARAKTTTKISQVQKVNVRVGGGGGMPATIVYATYAPAPPTQPTQFVFDNGLPPAPVKREPAPHSMTGVSVSHKTPSRPQPHQHMSPMSQYLVNSARAGAPPNLSSIYSESMKSEPRGPPGGGPGGGGGGGGGGGKGGGGGGGGPPSVSMKSEPGPSPGPAADNRSVRSAPAGAPGPRSVSMREGSVKSHHSDPVPAEPTRTHHHHDSPSARAMSEDSNQISMHSRARTPPRYAGTITSTSKTVKS
jgi:hypothetical protein